MTIGLAAVVLSSVLGGCNSEEQKDSSSETAKNKMADASSVSTEKSGSVEEGGSEGKTENTVMYVPYGDKDGYIMVDQKTGSVFTVTMPEEIYNSDGEKITSDELEKGNILKITGNGIMLESYPGQYPGVSRIDVTEEGEPSDADQYQEIVDQIWQEPDPAQVPYLDIEYSTDLANVTAAATTGGYQWEYPAEDGTMTSIVSDAPVITAWPELNELRIDQPTDLTLWFSEKPKSVTVQRWPEAEKGSDSVSEGEAVAVQETEEESKFSVFQAEPGYLYLVKAGWENGYTDYGFQILK